MKSFGISMIATYLFSCASLRTVNMTDLVAMVGELASYSEMKSRCLFPPADVRPLIFLSLFFLRNIWDSNNSTLSLSVRSEWCLGSNVFLKCNCFISDCLALFSFSPHCFKHALRENCIMIAATAVTGCAVAYLNSKCVSGCSTYWCSTCDMT